MTLSGQTQRSFIALYFISGASIVFSRENLDELEQKVILESVGAETHPSPISVMMCASFYYENSEGGMVDISIDNSAHEALVTIKLFENGM